MPVQLLLIALGTLASEDLTLAATGALIAQGRLGFVQGTAACVTGIFFGDLLIYFTARLLGMRVLRWRWVARLLPSKSVRSGAAWLNERGLRVVFLSRFTPGLRLPTYFAAGLLPTRAWVFASYFFLAAFVWTPLILGLSGWIGASLLGGWLGRQQNAATAFGAIFFILAAGTLGIRWLIRSPWLKRLRWEFWPAWAVYLPLLPYFSYLAIRHRSLTVFTASNPGMFAGGFVGESKIDILQSLPPESVATFDVISGTLDAEQRIRLAMAFGARFGWPFVLKPSIGERGRGVEVVRWVWQLADYLEAAQGDIIIQAYVPGPEFSIFYARVPGEHHGRILSITEKQFPVLTGDGKRSFRELVRSDGRSAAMARTYFSEAKRSPDSIPASGERVQLTEIGSHCRGALFLDGRRHTTPDLAAAVERISQAVPGFHIGRYDVRSASVADLRAGRFTILELNGVSAEPTHIYAPSVSLGEAYGALSSQWRLAFEIGACNRARGLRPLSLREMVRLISAFLK